MSCYCQSVITTQKSVLSNLYSKYTYQTPSLVGTSSYIRYNIQPLICIALSKFPYYNVFRKRVTTVISIIHVLV